jgi:hypothetical protein
MKNIKYTWNLTVNTITSITLQYSEDNITWIDVTTINNPAISSSTTVEVPVEAEYYRIIGSNTQTLCPGITSNQIQLSQIIT